MRRFLTLSAGLLGGAIPVLAQSVPPSFDATLTVTATAVEEPADGVPVAVDVLDAAAIAARQTLEAIDLLRTVARPRDRAHRLARQGGLAVHPRHQLEPHAGALERRRVERPLPRRLRLVDALDRRRARASRSCADPTRRSTARARWAASCRSSPRGGAAPGGRRPRSRRAATSSARRPGGGARPLGRLGADLAGHLRRGDGVVANDFYDGDEVSPRAPLDLGAGARLGALARRVASRDRHPLRLRRRADPRAPPALRRRPPWRSPSTGAAASGSVEASAGDDRDRPRRSPTPPTPSRRATPTRGASRGA